jgi:hypothetical protein
MSRPLDSPNRLLASLVPADLELLRPHLALSARIRSIEWRDRWRVEAENSRSCDAGDLIALQGDGCAG